MDGFGTQKIIKASKQGRKGGEGKRRGGKGGKGRKEGNLFHKDTEYQLFRPTILVCMFVKI